MTRQRHPDKKLTLRSFDKEIKIVRVEPNEIEFCVNSINLVFRCQGKKIGLVSKTIPDAQVFDPESIWVPKRIFVKACRQAAAIFASQRLAAIKKQMTNNLIANPV